MVFGTYANFYDLLYQEKEYGSEVEFLKRVGGLRTGSSILDLGCGTGGHDIPLATQGFVVTGIDLSAGMVSQAKRKALESGVAPTFIQGDLRSLRLGKTFDSVISMFAVMGYQVSNDDFMAALHTARIHLGTGSSFVFDAWFGPAVLADRPVTRVKEIPLHGERVIRIAKPELNALANTVTVDYTVLRLSGDKILDETHEAHPMRYLFGPEVAYFARNADFEVTKVCPFMDPDRLPTEKDWNVTWVLKAV